MDLDKQRKYFLDKEGNQWYERNGKVLESKNEYSDILFYEKYIKKEFKILEIGCAAGDKLNYIYKHINCECYGIDPSEQAVQHGNQKYPYINLKVGTADELPYQNEFFDFIIFGFCFYVIDRSLLSKVVAEADRVLVNSGWIGITDFDNAIPCIKSYREEKEIYTYKMDYSRLFLGFPHFTLVDKYSFSHHTDFFAEDPSERVSSILLYKNQNYAYAPLM